MAACATGDGAAYRAIDERNDHLGELYETASETVARTLINEEAGSEAAVGLVMHVHRLLLTIQDLEWIGDRAVNSAARTLQMAESATSCSADPDTEPVRSVCLGPIACCLSPAARTTANAHSRRGQRARSQYRSGWSSRNVCASRRMSRGPSWVIVLIACS